MFPFKRQSTKFKDGVLLSSQGLFRIWSVQMNKLQILGQTLWNMKWLKASEMLRRRGSLVEPMNKKMHKKKSQHNGSEM